MTAILGISAYYHDSAAVLIVDGEIAAAAQEERFTRIKHDFAFPTNAISYCLREAGLEPRLHAYGTNVERNAIHGSDSPENAAIETSFFFSRSDLIGVSG